MKRTLALSLSLMVVLSILFPTTAYAAKGKCSEHNYKTNYAGKEFVSDICVDCGYENVHRLSFVLPFITRNKGVVTRKEPRKSSDIVHKYKKSGEKLEVVGRVRNECNNLWLLLSDGSYTFADNAAFDFDTMTTVAISTVDTLAGPEACGMTYSAQKGLEVHCSPTVLGTYGSMFYNFRPKGTFDLKQTELLGSNSYDYYVYANENLLEERYTGESLGNILYGYVARNEGITSENAVKYAGFADSNTFSDTVSCFFLNDISRCDDENDIEMIELGWNHFEQPEKKRRVIGIFGGKAGGGGGGGGGSGF